MGRRRDAADPSGLLQAAMIDFSMREGKRPSDPPLPDPFSWTMFGHVINMADLE